VKVHLGIGFPKRLVECREKDNLTQGDLSVKSGLARETISRLETARLESLDYKHILKLVESLNVDFDWLVGPSEEKIDAKRKVNNKNPTIGNCMEVGIGFPLRLKRLRKEKGWNQFDLAREANISRSTINNLECGRQFPTNETFYSIADALNVDYKYLFGRGEETLIPTMSISKEKN
jgi:transcriptional regulator with XRE-family HTH domain